MNMLSDSVQVGCGAHSYRLSVRLKLCRQLSVECIYTYPDSYGCSMSDTAQGPIVEGEKRQTKLVHRHDEGESEG